MRTTLLPTAAAVTLALLATAGPAAAEPLRPCTPAEIAQADGPVFVTPRSADGYSSGSPVLERVAARRAYALVVDPYRFGNDHTIDSIESGSVVVTPPAGLALGPMRASDDVHAAPFTAPAKATTLSFRVAFVMEILHRDDDGSERCAADTTLAVPVDAGLPLRGSARVRTAAGDNTRFFLHLAPQRPVDPRPVTIALRLATGTATPPRLSTKPLRSYTVHPLRHPLPKGGYMPAERIIFAVDGGRNGGFDVEVSPSIFRGASIRFGFSVEVRQGGKAIAGMRSGAICRDRFFHRSDGTTRHRATCRHPGFAARP
jgi:hypothetical protein